MPRRALIAALIVLVALTYWVWRLESSDTQGTATAQRLFPGLDAQAVQHLTLTAPSQTLRLSREQGGAATDWILEGPPARPAEDAVAEAAAQAAATLSSTRTLAATADPGLGLGPSALHVTLVSRSGQRMGLRIGASLPVSEGRYVQVDGDDRIHVVSDGNLFPLEREPLDFHDLRILPIPPAQITDLELVTDQRPLLSVVRSGQDSFLLATGDDPRPRFRAKTQQIQDLLLDLGELRGRRFATPQEGQGGTDAPTLTARVRTQQGQTTQLDFGIADSHSDRFVQVTGDGATTILPDEILLVRGSIIDELQRPAESYLDPLLLGVQAPEIKELWWSVRGMEGRMVENDHGWSLAAGDGELLANELVEQILKDLTGIVTLGLVDQQAGDSGLESARLGGKTQDGTEFQVSLLRTPNHDYAAVRGESGLREIDSQLTTISEQLIGLQSQGTP